MKEIFYAIENLFVNYFFIPFDILREVGDYNWWLSNFMVWIFIRIDLFQLLCCFCGTLGSTDNFDDVSKINKEG